MQETLLLKENWPHRILNPSKFQRDETLNYTYQLLQMFNLTPITRCVKRKPETAKQREMGPSQAVQGTPLMFLPSFPQLARCQHPRLSKGAKVVGTVSYFTSLRRDGLRESTTHFSK